MRIVDIIEKKRDNIELTKEEIDFFLSQDMPDYQMTAFLMATYFNGMTDNELIEFTKKMKESGDIITFEGIDKFLVDKHSTGGVGDKVTIALSPIISALGMATAKLSGKGLGHTGGTIDKFESIKGFQFSNTKEQLVEITQKTGIGLMGYSDKIVPLDKKIYSLRDVSATVASIPLIASSIMSKKLAVQSDIMILDVKVGDGAFMKNEETARMLANKMITIAKGDNRNAYVVLSNMDEPLGHNVGNANEVIEAIELLKGNASEDLKEVIYTIASLALMAYGKISNIKQGFDMIDEVIKSQKPLNVLKEFIKQSGGDPNLVDDYSLLPSAKYKAVVKAKSTGYIKKIKTEEIGRAAMIIGAGRRTKESIIDHSVGLNIVKKVSDYVNEGDVICEVMYNDEDKIAESISLIDDAYIICNEKVEKQKVIIDIIK